MDFYQEKSVQTLPLRMDVQVFKSLAFCSGVLGLCGECPEEDAPLLEKVLGKDYDKELYRSLQKRCTAVVSNDQESVPVGLAMLWLAGLVSSTSMTSEDSSPAAQSVVRLTQVFTISRLAHSAFYYAGTTGVRSLAFLGGYLSSWGAGIVALKGLSGL